MTFSSPSLRPLTLPQMLDQTVRLYRNYFFKVIGIMAMIVGPFAIARAILNLYLVDSLIDVSDWALNNTFLFQYWFQQLGTTDYLIFGLAILLTVLNFLAVYGVANGVIAKLVANHYAGEDVPPTIALLKGLRGHWLTLIGGAMWVGLLLITVLGLGIGLPYWAFTNENPNLLCLQFIPILIIGPIMIGLTIYLSSIVMPLYASAAIVEDRKFRGAFARAWNLPMERLWPTVRFMFSLSIFTVLAISAPLLVAQYANEFTFGTDNAFTGTLGSAFMLQNIISQLLTTLITILVTPLSMIGMAVAYFDLRVRVDGVDLALRSRERDPASVLTPLAAFKTIAAPGTTKFKWKSAYYGRMFLLSIVPIGAIFILYMAIIILVLIVIIGFGLGAF